jgi:hypothetical protein
MGCDIHIYREKLINGVWVSADEWADEYDEGVMTVPYEKSAYSGRNYELFGFLAEGVRRDIPGAFEQRGTPDDASPEVAELVDRWNGDGHSHSWLGLAELIEANENLKTQTTPISGMMEREQWDKLQASIATGEPDWDLLYPYSQGVYGAGADKYVEFEVQVPATFAFGDGLQHIIDSFAGIDGDDHRIVFFFDN